ncbi:MAG: nitrile hydratase accessory protein [Haloferacaceae archaeon]
MSADEPGPGSESGADGDDGAADPTLEFPVPGDDGPAFEAPWQARVFGLAVALHREQALYDWEAFQARLIDEVDATDAATMQAAVEETYYEQWLAAFERLLADLDVVDPDELADRAADFAAGDRDASEFVDGDR